MLEKIAYAGTASRSHAEASRFLDKLAGLVVDEKQVERVTRAIGDERLAERSTAVQAFQELPLPQKFAVPVDIQAPELAVVMVDGGRMQILDRSRAEATSDAPLAGAARVAGAAEDWEEEGCDTKGHWREDKVGLLMTMQSKEQTADPCPEIPESFVDPTRIPRLVRELKKNVKEAEEVVGDSDELEVAEQALTEETKDPRHINIAVFSSVESCSSSRRGSDEASG